MNKTGFELVKPDTLDAIQKIESAQSPPIPPKKTNAFQVMILDDEPIIGELLAELLPKWGFVPLYLPYPFSLNTVLEKGDNIHIFLMDYMLPTETTIDWIPSIREKFPDAKIVVMTGYAEIDILLRAMRVGVMDFILKPIETALLKCSLQRVSQILSHEQEIQSLLLDLQKSNELLNKQKAEYQFLNERLLETNRAFSTLAQNLDLEKKEIERQIGVKIKNNILPLVAKLQTDAKYNLEVDMLYQILWELASGITSPNSSLGILSTAELRVASLIERGLTNEEIAEKLCISLDTVKTHRKHIRKKMKITNSSVNLKSLLMDRFFNQSRSQ